MTMWVYTHRHRRPCLQTTLDGFQPQELKGSEAMFYTEIGRRTIVILLVILASTTASGGLGYGRKASTTRGGTLLRHW